jgi:hypothetical protein
VVRRNRAGQTVAPQWLDPIGDQSLTAVGKPG